MVSLAVLNVPLANKLADTQIRYLSISNPNGEELGEAITSTLMAPLVNPLNACICNTLEFNQVADIFDPSIIAESGVSGRITALGDSIGHLIDQLNKKHSAKTGEDLFKATNKTVQALLRIRKPATDLE